MVFLRSKIVKNESYSYLVKSKWDSKRKTSEQQTVKYLGKTSDITLEDIPDEYRNDSSILSFLSSNKQFDSNGFLILLPEGLLCSRPTRGYQIKNV